MSSERISDKKGYRQAIIIGMIAAFMIFGATTIISHNASATGNTIYVPGDYSSIQDAINHASDGDTIIVAAGIYDEQIIIDKNLTIQGQGDATIIKPSQATANNFQLFSRKAGGSANTAAIVVANADATIKNLKIDGSQISSVPSGATLVGILYRGVNGTIDSVTVDNINISSGIGGNAIYISSMDKEVNVEVKECTISNFYKNGITANYEGLTVNIHDNNVTGSGPIANVAQNGIQIGLNAEGTIKNNIVNGKGEYYTGSDWTATGILISAANATVEGNTVINAQTGIDATGDYWHRFSNPWTVSIINNTVDASNLDASQWATGIAVATYSDGEIINANIEDNQIIGGAAEDVGIDIGISYYGCPGNVIFAVKNNSISNLDYGMYIEGSVGSGSTIMHNTIQNNVYGIYLCDDANAANVTIHYNNIAENSDWGIYNDGTGVLNATLNYWGDATGPYHSTLNSDGQGDNVSDNVEFTPWLDAPYPGGQPYADIFMDKNGNGIFDLGEPAFYSIQDAIDNASDGDTIIVHDGVYGPIIVNKSITLKNGSLPVIDGHQSQPCITVSADNVVIDGFVLFNGTYGVYMNDAGKSYNLTIRNCVIKNNTQCGAVYLQQNDADKNVTVLVENNTFEWNRNDNFVIKDSAYTQTHPDGFYAYRWIVRNNTFNPCGSPNWDFSGLGFEPALGVLVENNTFNTYWGIWMDNARYVTIRNNILSYSLGDGGAGIVAWGDDSPVVTKFVTIENNEIHGFKSNSWPPEDGKGIVIGGAENVTITHNRIYENNVGIWINTLYRETLIMVSSVWLMM